MAKVGKKYGLYIELLEMYMLVILLPVAPLWKIIIAYYD